MMSKVDPQLIPPYQIRMVIQADKRDPVIAKAMPTMSVGVFISESGWLLYVSFIA
jgi:hypothetical protein